MFVNIYHVFNCFYWLVRWQKFIMKLGTSIVFSMDTPHTKVYLVGSTEYRSMIYLCSYSSVFDLFIARPLSSLRKFSINFSHIFRGSGKVVAIESDSCLKLFLNPKCAPQYIVYTWGVHPIPTIIYTIDSIVWPK